MTRANARVRPATAEDVPALAGLVGAIESADTARAAGTDRSAELHRCFVDMLESSDRTVLVATDDAGDVTGLVSTRLDEVGAFDLTPVLHVTHLLVAPKQRRRGIGRALLAAVVHLAADADIENVLTTSTANSREGNRYLARIGFAPLVVHRIAPVSVLRRTLGMTDVSGRMATLRRARLARAQRSGFGQRPVGRGA